MPDGKFNPTQTGRQSAGGRGGVEDSIPFSSEYGMRRHSTMFRARVVLPPLLVILGVVLGMPENAAAQARRPAGGKAAATNGSIRTASSANFRLVTDLSEQETQELLARLETMLKLVSGYYGKRNIRTIDMYVARNIRTWPADVLAQMDPDGIAQIRGGGGVTLGRTAYVNGRAADAAAVVYAAADHGTPQHEAVHAYCLLAFGRCGPVWYAEGMAEVGQYWRENDKSVNAPQEVIDYLRSREPKPLLEIVNNPLETSGDSWQNYAWRWALCHLLGFNENYTDRFKPLGLAMLNGQTIGFEQVYGDQAAEIQFEYRFFLRHLAPGYRVDLCSWDWKSKPLPAKRSGSSLRVNAARGWQAAKVRLDAGVMYSFEATGEWTVEPQGNTFTADGDADGVGRLVGSIFKDYALSDEFELGTVGTFVAPGDGALFVRCRDDWGRLADNKGTITLRIRSLE